MVKEHRAGSGSVALDLGDLGGERMSFGGTRALVMIPDLL